MALLQLSLDDQRTLQAIGILADALEGVSGAGVIDTVLVSKALRQVLITRSRPAFDFASRAFSTLDPEVKRRVAADADNRAREHVRRQRDESSPAGVRSTGAAAPTGRVGVRSPSGILAALNNRGRMVPQPKKGEEADEE
jgi:hypothetical protein